MTRAALGSLVVAMAALAALATLPPAVHGQAGATSGEWRTYGGDLGHTRYAPLDQINAGNFNKLEVAWRFKTDSLGPRPEFQFESTPLMVKGLVYSTAGTRRAVVALDGQTGELVWMHSEQEGARGDAAPRQLSGRGLAYWDDGGDGRIIYVTAGYRMIALNARTGASVTEFGQRGVVDLKRENDQAIDPITGEVGLHATPIIANGVVIVGAAHLSGGSPRSKTNVKGYVRGYDARTGKRLWIFHTIPQPGEFGNDTWLNDSWSYTGNTGVWAQISVDEELGLAYLPVEQPTGDYYGGHRKGNNLFGESLVAVELKTGKRRWHYQFVHHPLWDMDIPCAPILVNIRVGGRQIKAVAQPTKQSFLYVFNRETGEPVWPIEERPVPQGDVPGEWYSPTQPFPTKPPPYGRQGSSIDELVDFTPEIRQEAIRVASRYKMGPIFTPPVVSKAEGPLGILTSVKNGTIWEGGSFDPETQMLYVFSEGAIGTIGLVAPNPGTSDMAYVQGSALSGMRASGGGTGAPPSPNAAPARSGRGGGGNDGNAVAGRGARGGGDAAGNGGAAPSGEGRGGGGGGTSVFGLPLGKPPYGQISAIDLSRGDILWQIAHGETPDNVRNHPMLKGLNIPRTGRSGNIGTLVTKSLLIAGEGGFATTSAGPRGAMLRAYDKATGKDAGAVYMPAPQSGSPMTYMLNGRQYVVIAIGGGAYPGELLAFRLPS